MEEIQIVLVTAFRKSRNISWILIGQRSVIFGKVFLMTETAKEKLL